MIAPTRLLPVVLAAVSVGLAVAPPAMARSADTFKVKIRNLTSGQPLTPPVVATHRGHNQIFRVGAPASFGVKEIAENGNNGPLLSALQSDPDIAEAVEAPGGPLVPAGKPGSAQFDDRTRLTIHTEPGARRLSLASMLICTNDGFTGANSVKLPRKVGGKVTVRSAGYDAHTERNTEDLADIVPPCQSLIGVSSGEPGTGQSNPDLLEGGVIAHHDGIVGGSDLLPEVHGWDTARPVARITIKATD